MANIILNPTTGNGYDPFFYAQEGLIALEQSLGMAARVTRTYDRSAQEKGSTTQIKIPHTFTVQDAPATAEDLKPSFLNITLDYWREDKFKLSDKEKTLSDERIITDHVRPMAYALARDIDTKLNALSKLVPWYQDIGASNPQDDLAALLRVMENNNVPTEQDPENMFLQLDPWAKEVFMKSTAFTQYNGSGDAGVNAQLRGALGNRYGFNIFGNQNIYKHTKGTLGTGDVTLAVNNGAGYAAGTTTVNLDGGSITGTIVAGDILTFAGHSQRYVVTNTSVTAATNQLNGVTIYPALKAAVVDNEVVTANLKSHNSNLAFHKGAFALVTAPLDDSANGMGVEMSTVSSPESNLTIRVRRYYLPDSSAQYMAMDVLFGVAVLDPNKAVRLRGTYQ